MAWYRGLALLSETRTGRLMIGGSLAGSAGTGVVLNRKLHVSATRSLASGAGLALAGLAATAWLGYRLVQAGEALAAKSEIVEELAEGSPPTSAHVP